MMFKPAPGNKFSQVKEEEKQPNIELMNYNFNSRDTD